MSEPATEDGALERRCGGKDEVPFAAVESATDRARLERGTRTPPEDALTRRLNGQHGVQNQVRRYEAYLRSNMFRSPRSNRHQWILPRH